MGEKFLLLWTFCPSQAGTFVTWGHIEMAMSMFIIWENFGTYYLDIFDTKLF